MGVDGVEFVVLLSRWFIGYIPERSRQYNLQTFFPTVSFVFKFAYGVTHFKNKSKEEPGLNAWRNAEESLRAGNVLPLLWIPKRACLCAKRNTEIQNQRGGNVQHLCVCVCKVIYTLLYNKTNADVIWYRLQHLHEFLKSSMGMPRNCPLVCGCSGLCLQVPWEGFLQGTFGNHGSWAGGAQLVNSHPCLGAATG